MSLVHHPRPALSLEQARALLQQTFGVDGTLAPLDSERDQNFHVRSTAGEFTFKIVNAAEPDSAVAFQTALLRHVEVCDATMPLPRVQPTTDGRDVGTADGPTGERHALRLVSYLPGTPMASAARSPALHRSLGTTLGRLARALQGFGHPGAFRAFDWNIRQAGASRRRLDAVHDPARRRLIEGLLDRFDDRIAPALAHARHAVIHNDANDWNVLVDSTGQAVTGIIDVGDAVFSPLVAEPAVAAAYAMLSQPDPTAVAIDVFSAFHTGCPLTETDIRLAPDLIAARLCISVTLSAVRQATSSDPYLFVSEAPAWALLEWLASVEGRRLDVALLGACTRRARGDALPPPLETSRVAEARRALLGSNVRTSYRTPLHVVEGVDVWLIAADGRRYLDCYNNVAHVGHCHPRVVAALAGQAARLNTNTRYLHENVVAYADRLRRTLPAGLDTFFFCNSGSEANDLALRIARTATDRHDMVVLDWAYHGHTQSLIDISPYKYKRAGGRGRPAFVVELPLPEVYRAPNDWRPFEHGARFAADARRRLAEASDGGARPAAFIAETIPSVGGQVFLPEGYLAEVYAAVRALGAVCIADEVQVGFGRVGTHMWAFQEHGIEPDIVTMGKPAGAGHPLGIVVTRRALADGFANGMEYFNTFGGNPVSCAVGLAVLDVIDEERLLENARVRGDDLLARFGALADRHLCIGDVRGRGLFFGLEIVGDRHTKVHDDRTAGEVVNRAKELGVLMGTDGPHDNVIKIRPPMTFQPAHADQLVETLDRAFEEVRRGERAGG